MTELRRCMKIKPNDDGQALHKFTRSSEGNWTCTNCGFDAPSIVAISRERHYQEESLDGEGNWRPDYSVRHKAGLQLVRALEQRVRDEEVENPTKDELAALNGITDSVTKNAALTLLSRSILLRGIV